MKILFVVSRPLEINTSASIRNRAIISGLVEDGHNVELVTTNPDKNHMAYDNSMVVEGVKTTYIKLNGIQKVAIIGRKFKFLYPLKRFVTKFINSHNIYDNLVEFVNHVSEIDISKYDLIISSSDPKSSHLFIEKAIEQQGFKGKWIQIWGDPFFGDITLSKEVSKKEIYDEERRLISVCDKVVYVSPMTLKAQKELYPEQAEKMEYIPIPYLNEIVTPVRNLKKAAQVKIAYCGDYTTNVRNIIPLYEAVNEMNGKALLTICGNSDINIKSTDNVIVLNRQQYQVVEKIEKEADILVHISNLYGSQIPGKIYQYSGTNKPILFILDGDKEGLRDCFNSFERFCFCDNDKNSIANGINIIIENDRGFEPLKNFSSKKVAEYLITV